MQRRAFTLIEMSIVLLMCGLLAGLAYKLTSKQSTTECYTTTQNQLNTLRDAVERFAIKNDRFPRPARRDSGVESTTYGREVGLGSLADIDTVGGTVYFGAIPFQALGIPVANAIDCWGNKFTYAVTKDLTDTTNFLIPATNGHIDIKSDAATVFLAGAGYAIISHGEDSLGAVKANESASRGWCAADGTIKSEDCSLANTDIVAAEFNNGKGAANYFDDLVVYRGKPWRNGVNDSNLYCWGRNANGYVGDGTTIIKTTPVLVKGGIQFVNVTTGDKHSCGVDTNGTAYCWGYGLWGQTGAAGVYGNPAPNKDPLLVDISLLIPPSGQKFKVLSAQSNTTCGITTTDWAYCWGKGDYGQLGNGDWSTHGAPQFVSTGPFKAIAVGANHVCTLNAGGQGICWGGNAAGQIGNGMNSGNPFGGPVGNPSSPTAVIMPAGVTFDSIASGSAQSCALDKAGNAYCWGMGAMDYTDSPLDPGCGNHPGFGADSCPIPMLVRGGLSFGKIAMGSGGICALTTAGDPYCWGGAVHTPTAVDVTGIPAADRKFSDIKVGTGHSCGVAPSGKEYCWGSNFNGALGTGGGDLVAPSTVVTGSGTAPKIFGIMAAGGEHSCSIGAAAGLPINSGWDVWGPCAGPCGGSPGTRSRTCIAAGGSCTVGDTDSVACITAACPPPDTCGPGNTCISGAYMAGPSSCTGHDLYTNWTCGVLPCNEFLGVDMVACP